VAVATPRDYVANRGTSGDVLDLVDDCQRKESAAVTLDLRTLKVGDKVWVRPWWNPDAPFEEQTVTHTVEMCTIAGGHSFGPESMIAVTGKTTHYCQLRVDSDAIRRAGDWRVGDLAEYPCEYEVRGIMGDVTRVQGWAVGRIEETHQQRIWIRHDVGRLAGKSVSHLKVHIRLPGSKHVNTEGEFNPRQNLGRYKAGEKIECRFNGNEQWLTGVVTTKCECSEEGKDRPNYKLDVVLDRGGLPLRYSGRDWHLLRKPGEWQHGEAVEFRMLGADWVAGTIDDKAQEYCAYRDVVSAFGSVGVRYTVASTDIRYPGSTPKAKWVVGDVVEFQHSTSGWLIGGIAKVNEYDTYEIRRDGTNYCIHANYIRKPEGGVCTGELVKQTEARLKKLLDHREVEYLNAQKNYEIAAKERQEWRQRYLTAERESASALRDALKIEREQRERAHNILGHANIWETLEEAAKRVTAAAGELHWKREFEKVVELNRKASEEWIQDLKKERLRVDEAQRRIRLLEEKLAKIKGMI